MYVHTYKSKAKPVGISEKGWVIACSKSVIETKNHHFLQNPTPDFNETF